MEKTTRDDFPENCIWETQCEKCGEYVLTDEWVNNAPYFNSCQECGGEPMHNEWQESDEPHPANW